MVRNKGKMSVPDGSPQLSNPSTGTTSKSRSAGNYARYLATLGSLDQQVIPKLVKRYGATQRDESLDGTAEEVAWLADILLKGDLTAGIERARQLLDGDWTIDQIYIDLLGGASRQLGELWTADKIDFARVTIAACRLRDMMEELTPDFEAEDYTFVPYRGRLLLSPVTGEQHTIGIRMAAAFFTRAGWDVIYTVGEGPDRFAETAGDMEIELVGFSIGSKVNLENLKVDIATARQFFRKRNRQPPFLVGGALISQEPELAADCGADGFAVDAAQALMVAQGFLPGFASK